MVALVEQMESLLKCEACSSDYGDPNVSSVKTLEDAKVAKDCIYIQMPVHEYGTLQFGKFEEINQRGYLAALEVLKKLEEENRLPSLSIDGKATNNGRPGKRGRSVRRNSV
ncbi:hypothetical protein C0989_008403 [Termitomyces sp. Mn162]|nr:hypothetical protein C0989_008403 [Termitomyces sp. Mn162]